MTLASCAAEASQHGEQPLLRGIHLFVDVLTARPDTELPEVRDRTPGPRGCPREACDFRDHHDELVEAGASQVFGVSSQDSDSQREVFDRLHLPFAMLSDSEVVLAQ